MDEKIVPIANNSEQYITFSVGQLQFIDSTKFSLLRWQKTYVMKRRAKLKHQNNWQNVFQLCQNSSHLIYYHCLHVGIQ